MSKRHKDLDRLINAHCERKNISRSILETGHARGFNKHSRFVGNGFVCEINGILANDPHELMVCYMAVKEGLALVMGFDYIIKRGDDG